MSVNPPGNDTVRKSISPGKKLAFSILVPLITLVLGLVVVEAGLFWLAEHRYGKGKLFEPDGVSGWRALPNLDMIRTNSNDDEWRVVTDELGFRESSRWREGAARRLLILGDSLAFGQGVNIEERFDSFVMAKDPKLSVVNAGTMGYGTYQEILRAKPFFSELRSGDALFLLTCSNDFIDVTRGRFAGRAKPRFYFSDDGQPIKELPGIDVMGWFRDKSYIASRGIGFVIGDAKFSPEREREGLRAYEAMIREELLPLAARGVQLVIGYYDYSDHPATNDPLIRASYDRLCAHEHVDCIKVNDVIDRTKGSSPHLLKDGHWNRAGNVAMADLLLGAL